MKRIVVGPVTHAVDAPPALVYEMLAAIGQGAPRDGERADVVDRAGNELVCDFWTRVQLPGGAARLVRTRERVTLHPPDRVEYEHLDGLVRGLSETITIAPGSDQGSLISYVGSYEPRSLLDALRARLLVRPVVRRVMRDHFDDLGRRAESRFARSRVYRREPAPGGP